MEATITRFNFTLLNKEAAAELAKHVGLRRDWMRVKKSEIISMLSSFPVERLLDACRQMPEFFDEEDIDNLTADVPEDELKEMAAEEEAPAPAPAPEAPAKNTLAALIAATPAARAAGVAPAGSVLAAAAPAPAPAAPDVGAVAALLAQLLATGTKSLNPDDVREIVGPMLDEQAGRLGDVCREVIAEAVKGIPPKEIKITIGDMTHNVSGVQHKHFERLLKMCAARGYDGHRLNVWLFGPPGTGKTTAARNVAKAVGLPFHCNGSLASKYELIGFIDAHGVCHSPEFRKAWEHGGVYLFDEIDGSDPKAVVAFNAALANGIMAFPDGMVERHADCVVIAAANTTGLGATAEFNGRLKLDAATLDRFMFLDWPIDEALERALVPAHMADWVEIVQDFRRKVARAGVRGVMVTPRATLYGASLLAAGMSINEVKAAVLRKGMNDDQWAALA